MCKHFQLILISFEEVVKKKNENDKIVTMYKYLKIKIEPTVNIL